MTNLKLYDIVFVSDLVKDHQKSSLNSLDLEKPERYYFDEIKNALKEIGKSFHFYDSPSKLIKGITNLENPVVLSIWAGEKSQNRKTLIPAICESLEVPYFGADAFVNALCEDKVLSKEFVKKFKIKAANYEILYSLKDIKPEYNLKYPVVVKPVREGGSIGISSTFNIAKNSLEANKIIKELLKNFAPIMIEEYIPGYEVSVLVFGNSKKIIRKGVTQLIINNKSYFENEVWGYEDKKENTTSSEIDGSHLSERIPWDKIENLFFALGKVELIRFDGRINDEGFYLLELSPDAYLGSDGSVGVFYTNKLKKSIKEMLIEFLENTISTHQSL